VVQTLKATTPIPSAAWHALALVALTNAMSLLDRNILAILAPRIKADLKIGDAEMGLLYGTVFALFYALFSLPLGRLADGWVRRKLLAIAIAFWSLATGLAAFASGFTLLAISRLGVGIGEGATQPAGMSLLYDMFPRERRGLVMAALASAIAVGLGASSILGGVAADWWDRAYPVAAPMGFKGWQFAFFLASAPGLLLAIALWRLPEPRRGLMDGIETPPDPHPFRASAAVLGSVMPGPNWISLWQRGASRSQWAINIGGLIVIIVTMGLVAHIASIFSPRPPLNLGGLGINPHALQWSVVGFGLFVVLNLVQGLRLSDRPTFAVLATSPSVIICMLVGALQTMINYGVMGFTPSFLMKSYGLSPTETGLQFGLLAAGIGIIGPMLSGPFSDKMNLKFPGSGRVYVTLVSLAMSPFVAFWTYVAPDASSFYLRFTLYSLILTAWLPPLYAVMFDQVLPRMRGITASTYIIISTIFGLGIGPYTVGMVSDAYDGDLGTAILSINGVAPVIIVLLVTLALRVRSDEAGVVERARFAGEPV
jgi:MFS transporter, Spinster family, sphingosine-1-phosphate transporter